MNKTRLFRKKRKRRQYKAYLVNTKAKPKHKSRSGRTGKIHSTYLKSLR